MIRPRGNHGGRSSGARRLVFGTSWQAIAQLAPLAINLTLTPYIIVGLGADRYSVFLLVSSLAAMLSQFDGGIGQAALRFFTINVGRGDAVASTRLVCTVSGILTAFGIVLTLTAFAMTEQVLAFFRLDPALAPEAGLLLRVSCALVGVMLLRNVFNSLLMAADRFRLTAAAILLGYAVYAVGLVLTVKNGWGLYGIAATMALQQLLGTVVTVPPALRVLDRAGRGWLSREESRAFFGYAWKVQVTGLLVMAQSQKDQLVAGRVLSAQLSGPYGQGASFAGQLRQLPLNVMAPLQAALGSAVGSGGAVQAVPTAERIQRIWVRLITGWCVLGVPSAYVGVRAWLPDSYHLAASVAAILIAGSFLPLAVVVTKVWALSLGHPEIDMRATILGLAVNIGASVLLYPVAGMLGVVVGTAVGQGAAALFYSWSAARILPATPGWFLRQVPWWQTLVVAVGVSAAQLLVAEALPRGVLGLLGAGAAALPAAVLYGALVFGRPGLRELRRTLQLS